MAPSLTAVLGVLYAEDFDDADDANDLVPAEADEGEPEVIDPTFTLAELNAVRIEARAEGEREARSDVQATLARTRMEALAILAGAVDAARTETREVAEAAAELLSRTVLSMLHGALPSFCSAHGEGEVRALVRQLLPILAREPRATIRLNPHALAGVQQELAAEPELAARITLVPADALHPGDLRVTWDEGGLLRDTTAIQSAMREALAELGLIAAAIPMTAGAPAPAHQRRTEYAH